MPVPVSRELERFLVLYDRLFRESTLWIERTPPDRLDWIPIDNPNVRFGDRVTQVTIRTLYIHLVVGGYQWAGYLRDCVSGAVVPIPRDPELIARLMEGRLVEQGLEMHEETMRILSAFREEDLGKTVRFAGDSSTWSVMGFLWAMYGHHAYHLGNLDIYLRQADVPAPDFFSFSPKEMA